MFLLCKTIIVHWNYQSVHYNIYVSYRKQWTEKLENLNAVSHHQTSLQKLKKKEEDEEEKKKKKKN